MSLSLRVLALLLHSHPFPRSRRLAGPLSAVVLACAAVLLDAAPAGASLSNVRVDPTAFSPNGDGVLDAVTVHWTATPAPESLRVEVRRAGQPNGVAPLRAFAFGALPAGAGQVTWDGRDTLGVVPSDGAYVCRVVELTAAGLPVAGGEAFAAVLLDVTAPPVARFYDGLDGRDTTSAGIGLGGYAPAADSVRVYAGGQPVLTVRIASPDSVFEADLPTVEGVNAFALESFDRAGNRAPISPAISITYRNTAELSNLRVVPFEFSPNGDGILDSTRLSLSLDAPTTRLLVQVRSSVPYLTGDRVADTLSVVTLYSAPAAAGDLVLPWDGRDSTGADVPGGNWWFFAQAESADAAAQPLPGRVTHTRTELDRSIPAIPVPDPVPARTTRSTITLSGVSADADTVRVWRGATLIGRDAAPGWSTTVPLVLGTNVLTFDATERSGNVSARGSAVTIVYEEPLGLHAPERFRANDVFDVNVSRTASSVRIDLYELGGRRVRTLLSTQSGDHFELAWNLRDDAGVTVGDGPYVARVTVSFADGGTETKSGAVVVAK